MHSAILETATLRWDHEDDCRRCAQWLARCPGLTDAVLTLEGDLGAGKTTFTRYLLRALGVEGRIKSPTYAVVESYGWQHQGQAQQAHHFDFYRFQNAAEWEEAGFRDLFAGPGLKVCEWPEKAGECLPEADLAIWIGWNGSAPGSETGLEAQEHAPDAEAPASPRTVTLRAHTPRGARWLREWEATAATPPHTGGMR